MTDTPTDTGANTPLESKKLPELQAMASQLGMKGVRRLRKGELIEAIRNGGQTTAASSTTSAPPATSDAASPDLGIELPTASAPSGDEREGRDRRDRRDKPRRVEDIALPDRSGEDREDSSGREGQDRDQRDRDGRDNQDRDQRGRDRRSSQDRDQRGS
ncbi:MAG: Rho termination factor N-terminal domain-containing protein, partial [Brachybacterium sp.]|nr:Rho termination factor N-terminal domain-containing protein [Brachybacterium sp.]